MSKRRWLRKAVAGTVGALAVVGSAQMADAHHEIYVKSIGLDRPCWAGGDHLSGRVFLSENAPPGGYWVSLGDNHPSVTLPVSVHVPGGVSSVPFSGNVYSTVSAAATLTVTASSATDTAPVQTTAHLLPTAQFPALAVLDIPDSVSAGAAINARMKACLPVSGSPITVTASPAIVTFAPHHGDPSAAKPSFGGTSCSPPTPCGTWYSDVASFQINTQAVTQDVNVQIAANGIVMKTLQIRPNPQISWVSVDPSSVIGGEASAAGAVTLSQPAPSGGATVSLSDNSSYVLVPPSVTVPAGATTAWFDVQTFPVTGYTNQTATIQASYNGSTKSAQLSVAPRTRCARCSVQ